MGTGIKGFKSQKILKSKLRGYTEDQSIDPERYVTIQELTGDKHGADVVMHGGFEVDGVIKTAGVGSNVRVLKVTSHNAQKSDFVRFKLSGIEASILSCPDVDTVILGSQLSFDPTGLDLLICRHITPSYNSDGSLNVLASQGPVQFNKDGVSTTVNYVTATPTNSDALPVNIVTVNGQGIATTVDLSGAQINVQLTDRGTSPDAVRIGDGTNLAGVTASNEIKTSDTSLLTAVNANGVVSTGNSSTATLGSNAVFTGTAIEIKDYSAISVAAISDVASATNGLSMQFSPDGVNWDHIHAYDVAALTGVSYTQASELRYFRIVYTNGASAQTYFRLTTILKRHNTMPSRYTFAQGITGTQFADNVKAVIHGLTTGGGGGYVPVKVNPSGALTVESTVTSSALPTGAATSAKQDLLLAELQLKADLTETQPVSVTSLPLPSGAATEATLSTRATEATLATLALETTQVANSVLIGATNETAPVTDTGLSGLNGRLQRIAQNLTTLAAQIPASLGIKTAAASLSVAPASDAIFNIKDKALTSSFDEYLTLTTVQTFVAPANAIGGKIMASDANTDNINYKQNGIATITSGMQLQPARSEDFSGGQDITVVSKSGTQAVMIQWTIQL